MNKIVRILCLFAVLTVFSCRDNDDVGPAPLRDFQTQYNSDIADIEEFLKTHSYSVVNNPGQPDDQDVTFSEVPEGDPSAIWNSPNLVTDYQMQKHNITYKIYFLKLREGGGAGPELKPQPCNVDAVLASYTGSYMFRYTDPETQAVSLRTNQFETVPFPQSNLNLESVITGWSEIFPQFRPGDYTQVEGEPTVYTDFGAGVMFLPSGLGYYGQSQSQIPAYSPLIFSFKLFEITRLDQDQDGVPSYLEDLDGDRYLRVLPQGTFNPDDTDGDLAPDYLDLDDDGDNVLTVTELLNETTEDPNDSYNFDTVPDCNGDTTNPLRVRRYRDNSCPAAARKK